jgi:hypothetical protein
MHRFFVFAVPLVLAACGSEADLDLDVTAAASDIEALRSNSDPNRIVVYSNNIENMIFDWKDLVHEMEQAPLRPDIFLVQQLTSKDEMNQLLAFMKARLGVDYDGVVAQNVPDDHRFGGEVMPRPRVTTGVIFRSKRFDLVSKDTWQPFGKGFAGQRHSCDERTDHSGYETLRVKLHDRRANEDVIAVSLRHWTWHACSAKNTHEIVEGHNAGGDGPNAHAGLVGGALHIVGGDFNDRIFDGDGAYSCWYRRMNGALGAGDCAIDDDFGFTDPLFASCGGDKQCVKNGAGIDSLFVRRGDGRHAHTDHFDIISYEQAHRASVQATGGDGPSNTKARDGYRDVAGRYSGHQARRAYVYYR